jgi:hypothetical protein
MSAIMVANQAEYLFGIRHGGRQWRQRCIKELCISAWWRRRRWWRGGDSAKMKASLERRIFEKRGGVAAAYGAIEKRGGMAAGGEENAAYVGVTASWRIRRQRRNGGIGGSVNRGLAIAPAWARS